jgi:hypothetical protein
MFRFGFGSVSCFLVSFVAACGPAAPPPALPDTTPPVTSTSPASQLFVGPGTVLMTTSEPATISWTVDGSDPTTSPSIRTAPSPHALTIGAPSRVKLRFFATDASGNREQPQLESYTAVLPLRAASIAGRLVFHELLRGGQAAVALFSKDPEVFGWDDPVGFTTLAAGVDGSASYQFEGLAAGAYWVAAVWWPDEQRGDPGFVAHARQNPIALDPAESSRSRADFVDLHLGACDPEGTGVDGELEVGEAFRGRDFIVAAFPSPVRTDGAPPALRYSLAPGADRRPFALCNLPPGDLWVSAATREEPRIVASVPVNPIRAAPLTRARIQLGAPRASLGSVRGLATLSRPDPGGRAAVLLTTEAPRENMPIAALQSFELGDARTFSYAFEGLGAAEYWVTVALTTAAGESNFSVTPRPMAVVLSARKDFTADFAIRVP